jgi:hypothetical protein
MDGLFRGVLGILLGAGLYSEVYPLIRGNLLAVGAYGKLTFPALVGVNHWVLIVLLVFIFGGFLLWLDRKGL